MKRFQYLFLFIVFCMLSISVYAQPKQFTDPSILSFEKDVYPAFSDSHSQLSVSFEHFKHLAASLDWKWSAPLAQWSIKQNIGYKPHHAKSKDNSISTFIFWIYAKKPIQEGTIRVEFLKNGRVCSYFDYGLNFIGWRGAWVGFDRDMQGKPEEGMDEMRVTAPDVKSGELYFDHVMLSSLQDVRQHTADLQAPYINPNTENHWLILLKSWKKKFDLPIPTELAASEVKSMEIIQAKLTDILLEGSKAIPVETLAKRFNAYSIQKNNDGTLKGLPIFFERFGETYEYLGAENYKLLFANPMGLASCVQLMLDMGVSYQQIKSPSQKDSIAEMYILLMRHFLDQGFQAGSALGTLHHLGYSMRNFYTAALLMKEPLVKTQLDQEVQQSMEWFAGTGEVKTKPLAQGMDIDAFNTSLIGRLCSVLMLKDTPEKARYLHAISRWIDNGFLYSNGTDDAFKPDGTMFHHRANYPAYSVGGLDGAVTANYLLHHTDFQLAPLGREHLKQALLNMRIYCNLLTWPLSLSGRHPDGKGHLMPEHYALMALTGTPDYSTKIDPELAAAYLRLERRPASKYVKLFKKQGIEPEQSPTGNWSYNYSCLNVHRGGDWSVTAQGFSRYLWSTEIYVGANLYGRYLNHGNLQIMASGKPISNVGGGFNQLGWDWNHFPGTTAAVLPMKELRANVKNLDAESGYEEMLLSDETFAGSLSLKNKQGLFAMKLHENPKYNGSLHARKSYFFFDNRVVALGTNIRSDLAGKPVNTTLFQVYLPLAETGIGVNGKTVTDFPYTKRFENAPNYFSDGLNNHFFVKQGNVQVTKSLQHSMDEETDLPTENNFALAAIDHGDAPKNASYEYLVLIQPTSKELETTAKALTSRKKMPYTILEQDSLAHIVYDKATQTTGYVLFEAGKLKVKADVVSVNVPCMIMTTKSSSNQMSLSVCDPDLHFYNGKALVKRDELGQIIEQSIQSMMWVNNQSAVSTIEVQLKGLWKITGPSEYIQLKSVGQGFTTLTVSCQHGFSREIVLVRN